MKKIPFSPPDISEHEINSVVEVLKSGWITTGPKTQELERKVAAYCNTSKAVCLNSATAAMELTLLLLGLKPDDEVITTAYTYTASASVICHVGAKLVIVDTKENSFEMDYDKLEAAITEKTKVIIPVDIAGVMCDYNKIFEVLNKKKNLYKPHNEIQSKFDRVVVLADAAHSIGAKYKNKMSGEVADFTCFSFHAVKNLTTGEGGAVTWLDIPGIDNEEIYKQFMLFSLHGQNKDALAKTKAGAWEYDIIEPYFKCNMTDVAAAIGCAQFDRYDEILKRREEIIKKYDDSFKKYNIQTLDHYTNEKYSSGHLYFIRLLDASIDQRNRFIELMAEKGVSCNVHYKPLPMLSAYKKRGFDINNYQNAYNMFKNQVSLPLHTCLTNEDVDYVIEMAIESLKELGLC